MHVYPDVYVTLQQRMIIWQKLNNIYSQIKICSIMKISPVIILKFSYFTVTWKAFTNKSNRSDLIHYILYCSKTFYVSVTRYTSHLLYEAQKRFVHVYDKLSLSCTVKYKVTDVTRYFDQSFSAFSFKTSHSNVNLFCLWVWISSKEHYFLTRKHVLLFPQIGVREARR